MAGDFTETRELAVVADGQDHVAVGGGKILVGHDVGVAVAHAARRLARDQVVHRLVGKAGHLHVEQREVDVLPWPVFSRCASAAWMATVA